jgi:predicted TIM-barrel fold metal-dependent hydrolase
MNTRVIDFRFRVPTAEFARAGAAAHHCLWWKTRPTALWRAETEPEPVEPFAEASLEHCVQWMRERDVIGVLPGRDMPCTSVPNDHLADLCRTYPDRFVAFAGVDPSRGAAAVAEVERRIAQGFRGMHLEVGWLQPTLHPDDVSIFPLYERCADLGAIAIIHVGPLAGPELSQTRPDAVCRVAREVPRLTIVMAHAAYPHADDAIMAVFKHDNIWLGPDPYHEFPGGERYREWANRSDYVAERMLYGSSLGWPQAPTALDRFAALGWRDEVLERLLWRNAAELLGMA